LVESFSEVDAQAQPFYQAHLSLQLYQHIEQACSSSPEYLEMPRR
jgi:hypothetical protein